MIMKVIQIIDVRWYNACAHFALQQAKALASLGHDVLLMADPGSPPAMKAREFGLNLSEEVKFSSLNICGSIIKMRKVIREFCPDIVLAHRGESHLIAALAARGSRLPVARFRGDVRSPKANIFNRIFRMPPLLWPGATLSLAEMKSSEWAESSELQT